VLKLRSIPVDQLRDPINPVRTMFDEDAMNDLCRSIRDNGVLQPLRVRPLEDGAFEVVVGHRRLIACRIVGKVEVPCLVVDQGAGVDAERIAENADREDMAPTDEARYYRRLFEELGQDVDKVCERVKRPRSRVEGRLLLLQGDPKVFAALEAGEIGTGVAEELNAFHREAGRHFHLDFAIRCGATRAQVKEWRARDNAVAAQAAAAPPPLDPTTSPAPGNTNAAALETPYAAMARPWEISSSLEPRECLMCGAQDQEYRMFREYFCAPCAQKHLVAMKQGKAG